jgi:hypothetical protein
VSDFKVSVELPHDGVLAAGEYALGGIEGHPVDLYPHAQGLRIP